jgi:hypothetical protein
MKLKLIALFALLSLTAYSAGRIWGYGEKTTTNSDAAVPTALSTTNLWVTRVTIMGKKSARTDNTGDVYIGTTSTNDEQTYKIVSGTVHVLEQPDGDLFNLATIYLDVTTANDGVVMFYQ